MLENSDFGLEKAAAVDFEKHLAGRSAQGPGLGGLKRRLGGPDFSPILRGKNSKKIAPRPPPKKKRK